MQVRGQQYKYRGHIVHFLRDVGKVYSQLPLLPPELDVILLRPPTASEHAHLNRQFRRQFRVRRRCLQEWLNFLSNNHPGYRGITVCQKRMSVLPEDGDVLDQVATAAVTDPLSANLGNIENDDVEPDEVDQSAVPDLLPEDTEMEALRSHVLGEERGEHLPVRPSTQHQLEMPDIRRTPINEFNHSQALLSLAFPTLFPRGQADFVEPRLRPIKYADYIQHALRWHDGRFARHPTFRFVVFNTLMRAQARAKSSYFVKEYQQRQGLITRDDLLEAFQNPESAEAQQLLNSINRQTAQLRGTRPYWYEWQGRGSSHCHGLFWMDGAPSVDLENEHLRKEFARIWRFHVTAFNPEPARVRQQGEVSAAKYCSKMEKRTDSYASMGRQILPYVSHQNPLLSFASRLMNKLLTERDFSGQEICHVLLNCELQEGTRVIRAVDCRPYEQQGRSLRLQGDHDDAEVVGIYEKYLSRPPLHEELTYLDFLANWNTSKRDGRKWTRWSRQAKPRVLYYFPRYKSNHQHHQYDDFCRVKLMLAHPHRDPNELRKINGVEYNSYASAAEFCYGNHRHPDDYYGTPNAEERRPDPDEFEEEFHEPDLLEEDWLELARQLPDCPPSQEAIDLLGRRDIDIQYDWTPHVGRYADPGIVQGDYWRQRIEQNRLYMDVEDMPLEVRDALNPEQRIVYDTFIGHFQCGSEEQILLHVDGGGGTGKSYMIKVLSSHLQRLAGNRPSPIWRAAPTGVASNQIMGTTLHSLLRLPMDRAFTELSPADANAIQKKLRDVRYLVIDEKSMLGLRQLSWIDKRLRQVFPARAAEFFGGISIILVGDFFQLPPIANKPLYFDGPLKDLHEVSGQTAYRAFNHTVFLKKVQRQQGDDQAGFRLALEELRGLKLSIESWKLLSQRVQVKLSQREEDTFDAALRIYSKKARVNEYNYEHLVRLKHPAIQVMAKNIGNGADKATSEQAGNLAGQFPVCIGARLMLTQNIWQPAGLVNGAQGTVYDIGWAPGADAHRDPPSVIMMVMDKYTGPSYLTTDDGREVVPILPVKRDFFLGTSACTRKQFPLMASYAITVHKSQSITVDKMVTDLSERDFQTGLSYVAVSRVKMLDGLMIDAPFERASLHYEKLPDGKHSSIMLFTLEALSPERGKSSMREHKTPAPEGEKKSTAQLKSEGALKSSQPTIASVLKLDVNKPTEQNIANSFISRFDKQHFQRLLVELIVSSNQSFSFAENPILREIFDYLSPSVSIQHANLCARAVRYKIIQEYNRHKQTVIEVLRNSPGALHISFDGWTSRNKLALYGIACFFRDEKNRPCKIMIGVPEAHRHFGSTIGGEVLDVLHTLGVSPEKIGYFTLDNAENNDTAMEVIGAELGFDGRLRRGRCIGHTINLSAKALLFGKNANAFEQQLSGAEALSDTEYAQWRKKGPVGKLHNIVVDVRISHRLIYLFKEVQKDEVNRAATLKLRSKKPLKLIIDNDTRWLSQLYMIRRALRLKTSIELLLIKYKAQWEDENRSKKTGQVTQAKLAKKPRILRDENQLTDKDWEVLYHLEAILTVFEAVVKTLEGDGHIRRRKQGWTGSYGNIWDVVLGYELLLNTLEEYKQLAADFPDPEHFRIGINLAWDKLDEYYQRLDETPIYYTAMALHPAYRWDWFDETWAHKPSWVEKAKEMVADVWLSDYAHLEVRTSSSRGDDEPPAKRPRFFNPFEKNSRLPNSKPAYAAIIVGDEYQAWQTDREASDGDVRDAIGYWITKQSRYPRLSRMALDFLTIQPMSAECERLFSAAGKMVSGLRTNLDAEIIAICQVLRSWYRAGLIKDLDPLLKSHLESKLDAGWVTLSEDELALAESKWLLEGENSASEVDDSSQQQQIEELVSTSEKSILLGTPIATSTRAGTPITSRPGPSIASQEGVRLGTPIESPVSSPSIWPRPARERHSRPPVQLQQSAIERPVMERRDFELPDPDWMRDLSHCPLSDRDKELLEKFWTELENDRMEHCARCQETWFDMGLKGGICKRCIARDKNKKEDEPWFFSAENQLDFGLIPAFLPQLTIVEEMLIARVHVFVNVMQVRGQQYKYRGHIVHFLRDVGKVYSQLPLLPPELDVILLRPPTASEHAHLNRQFRRQFRVRRRCLQEWLNFLSNNHPGYRGITVCQKRMSVLPEDGDVLDQVATAAVTDPLSANLGNIENDDVEPDEVDQSAVPDLLPEDTEMEALRSHVLGEERGEHLPVRPSTQHQLEMPDIRRTPINEFNHSQALLSLAFPTLFPRGQADFVEPRLRPIKYADYIQHALRWHDGRFARHPTFRFVVFNTLMRAQARAKSSYFVKEYQQRQGLITRDDLLEAFQNPESAEAQQLLNSINRQTAQLRGTRPYWYRKRRELESYAYNLDCPGAFITFSPADLHWRSLYQHLPQFQDWQELPEQQRMGMSSKLLRDNPHIAAWHFYRRFGLFRDIVLKQKFNVTDYWNRYEWQGRGSSHCHGLFWMDGAPSVDLENEHLRKEFARIWRFHVTAFNPEPARVRQQGEGNPLAVNPLQHPLTFQWLSQVLNRCQRHHCSETYCLRKKKGSEEISCRFFFPRDTRDTADVVRRQGQSYFSFEAARNDSLMNHYNRCLSLGWLANIDISPCTSLQAVINYAAKYCSKMEKRTDSYASLGRQILPNVSHQNPLLSFASRLMNKLLTERDFSGQEICHVLLNCELQEGTRVIRAVDCRPYEQQGRSLRLQGDHDDAEVVGIYEKYLSRPPLHEELTYLDFLANWNTSNRDGRKWTRWSRQAKPRVLYYFPRYKSNPQHHQYDGFCRVKLMLAHPHRDPNELRKINGVEYNSYASAAEFCYGNHRHPDDYYGTPNAEERRPDPDEFEEEFHEPDLLEEDWLELARQLPDCPPSQEAIDLLGRRDIDIQYDWTPHVGRYADPGIVQGDYWRQRIEQNRLYMDVEDMSLEVRDTLNSEQRIVYDTFIGHFQCGSEEQILLHVDGGGGTGKSYMVKVLSSHLQRLAGNRPSPIWRAAPTGVASNQIMGTTLHSLLRLPVDRAFTELSPADANAVQNKLRDVRYLVIDEKSMLGLRQLSWIDKRLRQVFPARAAEFFGGISIILVGDFFQLPPIANKPLYFDGPLKDLHEVSGQTAYRAFNHTVFLKKVQRQQGDDQAGFRLALEELRGLKLSIESWKLLSQRVQVKLSQREEDTFDAALRIYSKKARVNEYNYEHLVRLKHPAIQVMAKNIGNGADKATSEQAGNLAGQFPVCIGARLMLTQNIWQPAGLVNGAQGTVYDIGWAPGADAHRDPPSVIMMVMDKYTGPSYLTTDDGREVVPILPVKRDFFLGTSACTRKQFPLMASYAITVHKSQSITVDKMVTDLSERDFQTGLSYVAVSRVKMLDGLMIDAPFERASLHYEKLPDGKHSSIMLFTLEALYVLTD
ncbi:hypothetical protein FOFC_03074 [Fusarium oxysporum]|nr:hypothetical protein FOFC_03074 [Fusarium oxysporum]